MRIERRPVGDLNAAAYNPRQDLQPTDRAYREIAQSIDRWGLVDPLVWNERSGNLVAGHQRLKVLRARGVSEVDVSVVSLDLAEEQALNVALNNVKGDWDKGKLYDVLENLQIGGFDMTVMGFSPDTLATLAADLAKPMFLPAPPAEMPDTELQVARVTPKAVAAAEQRQDTRFQKERQIHDVVCPHCGKTFGM